MYSLGNNKDCKQGYNMPAVQIVILAKSVKHGKHCVAGKCIRSGRWYRPVSTLDGTELSDNQVQIQNKYGTYSVKPLQKIEMRFFSHAPLLHQPDNYLIDNNIWQQRYRINLEELNHYFDEPENIWGEGNRVSYDLICAGQVLIQQSLYLVQVESLNLYYTQERKRRASFIYNQIAYDFAVTDPNFDKIIEENLSLRSILCISLGEVYNRFCYKLIATIF